MTVTSRHAPYQDRTCAPQTLTPNQPEWVRLPRAGEKCPHSNLSRSTLNNLILPCKANKNRPPVRSSVVRQRGATRGVRLIHRESLLEYIAAGQEPAFDRDAKPNSIAKLPPLIQGRAELARVQTFSSAGKRMKTGQHSLFYSAVTKPFGPPNPKQPPAPGGSFGN